MNKHEYEVGDVVEVGPAYRGSGQYSADGHEGIHTVCGVMPRGDSMGNDYYLAKGHIVNPSKGDWTVIINSTRFKTPE